MLLLLDNASARPGLERNRRRRLLAAAVLLDLAYGCRVRPTTPGEPPGPGRLVLLMGPDPADPVLSPVLRLLSRRPISPQAAIAKLQRGIEGDLLSHLERTGQVRSVPVHGKAFKRESAWLLTDRTRAAWARARMLETLFEDTTPTPWTAAVVSLLHSADGLGALLSLDQRGWDWVNGRAAEIASGSWVSDSEEDVELADVNLAVTIAALRPALA